MNEQQNQGENKPYKMAPNIAGVVAYFPFLGSIFVYVTEKENKFVRFHAMQSFIFWIAALGMAGLITSLKFILVGFLIEPIFQVAVVVLWFFLIYKAYNNEEYQLPIIGKIAKDQVYRRV